MTDPAYQMALLKKEWISQEMDRLGAELRRVEEWLDMYREFAEASPEAFSQARSHGNSGPDAKPKRSIADAAYAILEYRGGPFPTQALLELLEVDGVVVGGKDRVTNLSSSLSRDDRFRNIKGEGWVLASDPRYKPRALPLDPEELEKTAPVFG